MAWSNLILNFSLRSLICYSVWLWAFIQQYIILCCCAFRSVINACQQNVCCLYESFLFLYNAGLQIVQMYFFFICLAVRCTIGSSL